MVTIDSRRIMRHLCFAILLASGLCLAQPVGQTSQPATRDELKFLRFMLLNVASIDHSPDAVKTYETSLVMQFGLSVQESAAIHAAGQTLNPLLTQLRQSTQTLLAGKASLSTADAARLANLNMQREETIATLANQILTSVSPLTATRLRAPGHIMANASIKKP
jgi:hypothetical protein